MFSCKLIFINVHTICILQGYEDEKGVEPSDFGDRGDQAARQQVSSELIFRKSKISLKSLHLY